MFLLCFVKSPQIDLSRCLFFFSSLWLFQPPLIGPGLGRLTSASSRPHISALRPRFSVAATTGIRSLQPFVKPAGSSISILNFYRLLRLLSASHKKLSNSSSSSASFFFTAAGRRLCIFTFYIKVCWHVIPPRGCTSFCKVRTEDEKSLMEKKKLNRVVDNLLKLWAFF